MYSKLPARPDNTPTKVIFEGVEPGSPAAQRLFQENMGVIGHFHQKARQQRVLSEQPQAFMQQALPGGGKLSYRFNNGQETLLVRLNPRAIAEAQGLPELPKLPPPPVWLAIDVLYDVPGAQLGAVASFRTETVTVPGTPGEYYPETDFFNVSPNAARDSVIDPVYVANGDYVIDFFTRGGTIYSPDEFYQALDMNAYNVRIARGQMPNWFFGVEYYLYQFHTTFGISGPQYSEGAVAVRMFVREKRIPGTPPTTTTKKIYTIDRREMSVMLNNTAVINTTAEVLPEQVPPYIFAQEPPVPNAPIDARLVPCSTLTVAQQVTRTIPGQDLYNQPVGFIGAGFLAQPLEPSTPGGPPPEKQTFDVRRSAADVNMFNTPATALAGSRFAVDDSSMRYELYNRSRLMRVRVREFTGVQPAAVKVHLDGQQKKTVQEDNKPDVVTYGPSVPARPLDWFFAAIPAWLDNGNEPALPDQLSADGKPTMGKLLAEVEFERPQTPPRQAQRREFAVTARPEPGETVLDWDLICQITWTPAETVGEDGTAEIALYI